VDIGVWSFLDSCADVSSPNTERNARTSRAAYSYVVCGACPHWHQGKSGPNTTTSG